uniref:DDRGK domain-containing protein 1 n=1 Tax=Angiostrongylus cantonensis TaxID=6313 RepID=A0A0K0D1N1_ANGCA
MAKQPEGVRPEAPFKFTREGFDPLLLGSVGILLTTLSFIIYRLLRLHWDEVAARKRTEALLAMAEDDQRDGLREAQFTGGRRRNVRRRLQHQTDDFVNQMLEQQDPEYDDPDPESSSPIFGSDEKIGKRKVAKLQAKAERKALREQELIEREERKRREKEKEEKLERERAKELEEERLEQERLAKEKEEREKKELEEYLALKSSFAVEEEGFDQIEEEESNNLMEQFAEYVKTSKIVNMDELAAHFGLKSDEAISRLHYFLDNGFLQGVMDDRGKFICITDDELNAGESYIWIRYMEVHRF